MKTFSLSMQTGDDPKGALTEIIEALQLVCEDLSDQIAAGGITIGSDTVVNKDGIGVGRWSMDRQTAVKAAEASFSAAYERAKNRPEGYTEATWNVEQQRRAAVEERKSRGLARVLRIRRRARD